MMFAKVKKLVVAAGLLVAVFHVPAHAASIQGGVRIDAPGFSINVNSGRDGRHTGQRRGVRHGNRHNGPASHGQRRFHQRDFDAPRFHGGRNFWAGDWRHASACLPDRAVNKARHMGLRHAHVVRVNRHKIVVAGRKHGGRAMVGFSRYPGCPVQFVRRGW